MVILKVKVKIAQSCGTLCNPMDCSPWNSGGQNTGVGSPSLLQGSNPHLTNCQWILYQLNHQGSQMIIVVFLWTNILEFLQTLASHVIHIKFQNGERHYTQSLLNILSLSTIQTLKLIAIWQVKNYVNKWKKKVKLLLYERK